ncbi:GM13708 [Drosophila sechellia]|uniref:GM13708 n=1 Tax=Drosophila sechellia TaxID=7238 RepID=B4IJP2_DROSE|nr:GM13708 [Drosophila sechellia]
MNHLRVHKFKLGGKDNAAMADLPQSENTTNNNNDVGSNNNQKGGAKGFLGRIKRYSVLGNKLGRRNLGSMNLNPPNNIVDNSVSPTKLHTGSYNMTGSHSDDHRLEIGAPILISTTTLDTDRFDVTEARLKQIGGGIAQTSSIVRTLTPRSSDEEEFVDARSSPQQMQRDEDLQIADDQGEKNDRDQNGLQCQFPKEPHREEELGDLKYLDDLEKPEQFETPTHEVEEKLLASQQEVKRPIATIPIAIDPPIRRPRIARQTRQSQSVQNLHRSELKVYLHKSNSMALDMNVTAPAKLGLDLNLPELPELYGASELSLAASDNKENMPAVKPSAERSPIPNGGFMAQQPHFKSLDSFHLNTRTHSHQSSHQSSRQSLACSSSNGEYDFDLKSVSYQSLNAQNLFVSIDELQELTRQINETEDFGKEIDLEYCAHRDQLRPSERRITLLKNKNQTLINFNHNKEKLRKGWHGMKHWLGEEGSKIKEAVRQQTPLKRLAQSRSNLNQSTADASRQSMSPERTHRDVTESCEDVTERTEMESSMSHRNSEEDLSPHAKRFKDEVQV